MLPEPSLSKHECEPNRNERMENRTKLKAWRMRTEAETSN
ncbi:unnamed protein product [Leptidea sinapis]|uniref:Uncharacterized protein n=1 Tax=Leptidea sinapis TaxID=189913 RepID=A0A5E4QP25_9NEOP|nr:unnamed protein product [Leptidea sinapis]